MAAGFPQTIEVGTTAETLLPRAAFDGLTLMQAGVAKVLNTDVDSNDTHSAIELIESVELIARQVDAARIKVLDSIDRSGVYAVDGHRSARVMVEHVGQLSSASACVRAQIARACRALPEVADRFEAGRISYDAMKRIGQIYSNPRVQEAMVEGDRWFADRAEQHHYGFFNTAASQWMELADEDGAESRDDRHERDRNHRMTQNAGGSWSWEGSAAGFDGAVTNDVFEAFVQVEFDIDWQWTLAEYGEAACPAKMPRTAAQRRADAFARIHVFAAKGLAADGGPEVITDVIIDQETFERETARAMGDDPGSQDPTRESYRCSTINGTRVPARSTTVHALVGQLRRVLLGAGSVVTDLGRKRVFTGYARLAAQIAAHECYWPGCHMPATRSQVDHLTPHSERGRDPTTGLDRGGGLTNPANAGVCCGKHNRHKEQGYTVTRLVDGTIEIRRPDGSILS